MNIQEMAEYKRISVMPSERGPKPSEGSKAKSRVSRAMAWIRTKFREMKKRIEKFFETRDEDAQSPTKESPGKKGREVNSAKDTLFCRLLQRLKEIFCDKKCAGETNVVLDASRSLRMLPVVMALGIIHFVGTLMVFLGGVSLAANILMRYFANQSLGTFWLSAITLALGVVAWQVVDGITEKKK